MDLKNSTKFSEDREVDTAYIITLRNNEVSETSAQKCIESCKTVGMNYRVWEAFDGTKGEFAIPNLLKNKEYIYWLKWLNPKMSLQEVACVYSHYSLWCHCITIDKPIVILEHDALMVKKFNFHAFYNCIEYLGHYDQLATGFGGGMPYSYVMDKNWRFMSQTHAYAVDPTICRRLVSHFVRNGITESLDIMIRLDLFPVMQKDFYAFNDPQSTSTIKK